MRILKRCILFALLFFIIYLLELSSIKMWLVCVVFYFLSVGFDLVILLDRKVSDWVYAERWGVVLWVWVIPLIILQIPMVGFLYAHFVEVFASSGKLQFPAPAFTIPIWPILLLLWFVRDRTKELELKQAHATLRQEDFHKLEEWIGSDSTGKILRLASIHQLKGYLTGEAIDGVPERNQFQVPSLELFKAILGDQKRASADLEPIHSAIASALCEVFDKRRPPPYFKKILKGANLSGLDLSEINLSRADLSGSNMFNTTLTNARLVLATLEKVDLSHSNLESAYLVRSSIYETNLSYGQLIRTSFDSAKIGDSDLSYSNLLNANLANVRMENTKMNFTNLMGANLEKIVVSGGGFNGCNIYGAKNLESSQREYFLSKGAVELPQSEWWDFLKKRNISM